MPNMVPIINPRMQKNDVKAIKYETVLQFSWGARELFILDICLVELLAILFVLLCGVVVVLDSNNFVVVAVLLLSDDSLCSAVIVVALIVVVLMVISFKVMLKAVVELFWIASDDT